jgi:hypothetical protein
MADEPAGDAQAVARADEGVAHLPRGPHRAVDGVFDVAVLGDIPTMSLASLLRSLAANSKPVVLVVDSNAALATIKKFGDLAFASSSLNRFVPATGRI